MFKHLFLALLLVVELVAAKPQTLHYIAGHRHSMIQRMMISQVNPDHHLHISVQARNAFGFAQLTKHIYPKEATKFINPLHIGLNQKYMPQNNYSPTTMLYAAATGRLKQATTPRYYHHQYLTRDVRNHSYQDWKDNGDQLLMFDNQFHSSRVQMFEPGNWEPTNKSFNVLVPGIRILFIGEQQRLQVKSSEDRTILLQLNDEEEVDKIGLKVNQTILQFDLILPFEPKYYSMALVDQNGLLADYICKTPNNKSKSFIGKPYNPDILPFFELKPINNRTAKLWQKLLF